jgi:hypothetical protein
MRNKLLLLIGLLLCCQLCFAQVPGYMGRKISLNYAFCFSNAFSFPTAKGNTGLFAFNKIHQLDIDFVVARRTSLGITATYAKTSFPWADHFSYESTYTGSYYNQIIFRTRDIGVLNVYSGGIYLKRFFKGYIAPLGCYFKPGINLDILAAQIGNPVSISGDTLSDLGLRVVNASPYFTWHISAEIGQTHIFWNRLILDYGLRLGINPLGLDYINSGRQNSLHFVQSLSRDRALSMFLVNARIGVGILL